MSENVARLDRLAVARALREMASRLRLIGEEPFKVKAYERGARVLERLDADFARQVEDRRLTQLPGIGPGLAAAITELHLTGSLRALETLRERMPRGALELSLVPGLGLDKITAIHAALGVETIAELKAAGESGRLRTIRGIGPKTERKILASIDAIESPGPVRVLLHHALDLAETLVVHLREAPAVRALEVAGALRRWTETVDALTVVMVSERPAAVIEHALRFPVIARVTERADTTCRAMLATGMPFELRVVSAETYPTELLYATGAPAHVTRLEAIARERGLDLGRSALRRRTGGTREAVATEADVYERLGFPYLPPEVREDQGEIDAAMAGRGPTDLVALADIQGFVHCHTVYSDGKHTVEQMARAADSLGVRYLTITDHSPTASYAGGLTIERLKAQWEEIARVQESVSVRLLRGTESDILADGALDYPDAILAELDIVIASVHSRMRMDAEQMTRRLVQAMKHPYFKIWGHALGRLVLSRPPIECRIEEVLDAAAASRAAIEINGDPHRLDMEPRWVRLARERGIRFVVSTDAHSMAELGNVRYGVAMARKGWVGRGEVLNTLDADAFVRAVSPAARA